MDVQELSRRLKAARERAGLRHEHLAVACDVTARTIDRWERGEYALSVPQLLAWAECTGVDPAELIGRSDSGEAA